MSELAGLSLPACHYRSVTAGLLLLANAKLAYCAGGSPKLSRLSVSYCLASSLGRNMTSADAIFEISGFNFFLFIYISD